MKAAQKVGFVDCIRAIEPVLQDAFEQARMADEGLLKACDDDRSRNAGGRSPAEGRNPRRSTERPAW